MTLVKKSALSPEHTAAIIKQTKWYHSIELCPGVVTPGCCPAEGVYNLSSMLQFIEGRAGSLQGKRILEVGTWDGPVAYMLKSLGYDVTATDIQNPANTGFDSIGKITGLHVPYKRCSVYELPRNFAQEFDVVLFFGVFYHLKYPVLAFERIAAVMKPLGKLVLMGSGVSSYFESLNGEMVSNEESSRFAETLAAMDKAGIPICLCYPGSFLRGDNWFMPNVSALKSWMRAAGFSENEIWASSGLDGVLRLSGSATLDRSTPIEHGLVGESEGYNSTL